MSIYLSLLERAMKSMPSGSIISPDEIQHFLAGRKVESLHCLASDFVAHRESLSSRSLAVIARGALEAMFGLRASLLSKEVAIDILYTSTTSDLEKVKKMKDVDPNSPPSADNVISALESEKDFIVQTFPSHSPKKRNVFNIAEKAECVSHYRSSYFTLSQYVHSNYATIDGDLDDLTSKIAEGAVMVSCLLSVETIADFYSHPDENELRKRSRELWNGRTG